MKIEYIVLETHLDKSPFEEVSCDKLKKHWTLQQALDELGPQGWNLCTTIYGPTKGRDKAGIIFARGLS
ncbi:MAG: hypothetical protein ACRER2_08360 [Methylococcales bacterium]